MEKSGRCSILKASYGEREVAYYQGFLFAKKESNKIFYSPAPCNFNKRSNYTIVYQTSTGIIQDFYNAKEDNSFYLIDEIGSVKIVTLEIPVDEEGDAPKLKVQHNYYINKDFAGGDVFTIADGMLYSGFKSYILQKRSTANEEFKSEFRIKTFDGLEQTEPPVISDNTIIFIGVINPNKSRRNQNMSGQPHIRMALIMPLFNSSKFRFVSKKRGKYLKNEFFYKIKNTKEEIIVYQFQSTQMGCIEFDFYDFNGRYIDSIKLTVPGVTDYDNFKLKLSPDGTKIFIKEKQNDGNIYDGKVYEIVTLIKKSLVEKIMNFYKKGKRYEFGTDNEKVYFDLKLIRVVKDIDSIFGLNCDPDLTNDGILTYANGEDNLYYDTLEITEYVKNKLSKNDQTKKYETIDSYTWIATSRSYIAYKSDKIF